MRYFDNNVNVLEWASEEVSIPYQSPLDGKVHRYYPDFLVKVKRGPDTQIIVIEVKPEKQTKPPKQGKRKLKVIYMRLRSGARTMPSGTQPKTIVINEVGSLVFGTERTLGLK